MHFRCLQPFTDQVDVGPGRSDTVARFFLEAVQNIHGVSESDCVDRPIGVAPEVFGDLGHARAAKPLERLRLFMLPAGLGQVQGIAEDILHDPGSALKSFLEEATQKIGLG